MDPPSVKKTTCRRMLTATFLLSILMLWMFYRSATDTSYSSSYLYLTFSETNSSNGSNSSSPSGGSNTSAPLADFLVYNSKCRIPNYEVFSEEIKPFFRPHKYFSCNAHPLLTYVTRKDNKTAVLHVDEELVSSYSSHGIRCCYSVVSRNPGHSSPDDGTKLSRCKDFKGNVTLSNSTFLVICKDAKTNGIVYNNTHTTTLVTREVQKKLDEFDRSSPYLSVLFVGIDSISRLNLIRMMPNTYQYLKERDWIEFKGYNKMGDNTFPNLMAIFTGKNESTAYDVCNPKKVGWLDRCNFIFFNYSDFGYVTAYAEDEAKINTFNYKKKGFLKPPTDYYFRPYAIASELLPVQKKDSMKYCVGPENYGERILNVAKDFAIALKDQPTFGFFWMNSFSHNELNTPSSMDYKVRGFLRDITSAGVLNNSLVIFLSDHGLRFGEIRFTDTGWLEERLPYLFFSVPRWFQERHPREFANLKGNVNKLTTPYDLHMTLQDVLVRSGRKYVVEPASGCPTCKSLFEAAESERGCEDAGITQHWCTCVGYKKVDTEEKFVVGAAWSVINKIEEMKRKHWSQMKRCAKYSLKYVMSSDISDSIPTYKNNTYLKFVFKTVPSAVFEATVEMIPVGNNGTYQYVVQDGISRLDYYSTHAKCVKDAHLQTFCYCR